ncbi:MAG: hypothetical protein JNN07_02605 [Verrucomicrobiales bacterium]|nr:hypothetical protein [Verrucomicrobiales bacterium]
MFPAHRVGRVTITITIMIIRMITTITTITTTLTIMGMVRAVPNVDMTIRIRM